jgi:acyl-coenzyme A synthetase/AMP-(fatty) acid ligase
VILHSSGTTGGPKLVPRTHRNLIATCQIHVEVRGLSRPDRGLSLSRTTYSLGLSVLIASLFSGSSLISVPELNLAALPNWMKAYRPTYLSTTPAVLRTIETSSDAVWEGLRQASLRHVLSSGAPLSTDEVERLEETLQAPILDNYGMSEAPSIAAASFPIVHRVPSAVGVARCEIRTVDEQGNALGQHETGEIVVRGPRVFPGYLDDPEANAAAFLPGGWFRTGDVGFLDDGGYLHLTGRLSELINRGGAKIAPVEVDHTLLRHPAVAEAAVFAVPDARLGEDIMAAVVLRPGASASQRELRRWMLDRLSPYKVPRRIWLVEALPRTRTGKVQRGELTRRWSETRG